MPEKFTSYLSELKFDPKLWKTLQAKYLTNFRLVTLLIVSIVGIGLASYFTIPRRLNPEIKIPIVIVNVLLPGASPKDVESLVTVPLEDKLNGVKGLDTMSSTSRESFSTISMQFHSGIDPEKARSDVQSLVDTVILPTDAKSPTVLAIDFEDQPVWTFAVTTKEDLPSLMAFSKELKEKIKNLSKVDRVVTSGFDQQEIQVVIDQTKMKEFNITPLQLSQAVSKAASSYPAGSLQTDTSTISLSIDQDINAIDDIRNIHILNQGQVINLSDIATIIEHSKPLQPKTYYASAKTTSRPTVQFFVYKTSSSDIDAAEKDVKKIVNETVEQYRHRFEITTINSTAERITKQFGDLINEFQSTIILVFINLLLFLGLRQAFISSLTVPLTFLSAITIVNLLGMTLNFLTSFAFLIALGLLIDDTIVSVAAMTRYYATGKFTPAETGLLVWRDFIVPLWSTTITTIWAFVPLLLSTGIIGEFIKPIPIVVTATMISSTSIAVLITLPLMIIVLKPNMPKRVVVLLKTLGVIALCAFALFLFPKTPLLPILILLFVLLMLVTYRVRQSLGNKAQEEITKRPWLQTSINRGKYILDHGLINTEKLSHKYMGVIDKILGSQSARRLTIGMIVMFALVAYLLLPLGLVTNEFFPKSDQDLLYVSVDLPSGTNIEKTNFETVRMLNELRKTEYVDFIIAESGTSLTGNAAHSSSTESFLLTIHLIPKEKRHVTSIDIGQRLRDKYKTYSRGTLSVIEQSGGPPAGSDLQIKLSGDDLSILDQYANKIVAHLKKQPGVTNVDKSIKSGTSKLVFVPDKTKLAEAGLTPDTIGLWLRTSASGFTLDTIKLNQSQDDTDIIFRLSSTTLSPEDLGSIYIPTPTGASLPLLSLGSFKLETNPTVITREEGKRTLSVTGTVTKGFSVTEKNKELETFANTLHLPPGYSWQTGGVNEENQKSVQSIMQAMLLSFLLILITMVIEFGSFRQALIIMLVIPLAIPGVFYVFALLGIPLSFPALIGMLALFGIVVTNGIVVVEKINDNRRHGLTLRESIVDASGSRLEPILLTSVTSILGLIPITLSDPVWRGLGGAIISGLLFSGLIKLFFVPVVYYSWYKGEEEKNT